MVRKAEKKLKNNNMYMVLVTKCHNYTKLAL